MFYCPKCLNIYNISKSIKSKDQTGGASLEDIVKKVWAEKITRTAIVLIGDVIQQTGGLRKIRWSAKGKGKRGGVRVIYYYVLPDSQIRLLLIYQKGKQDDLTPEQKKILRQLNERWQ